MDKENNTIDKALEQALDCMESAEQLTDEDMQLLNEDEDFKQAFREVLDCKTAARKEYGHRTPDVEAEWERFQRRQPVSNRRRIVFWTGWGAAAVLLIALVFSWVKFYDRAPQEGVQVFAAVGQTQDVILQTADGQQLTLSASTSSDELDHAGVALTQQADTMGLVYSHHGTEGERVETHILSTPRGRDFKVTLDDGSTVWLNAESRLEYPSHFVGKERRVRLHGEAYFDIAHNAEAPFIIETKDMQTRVLGTEFNLCAYSSQNAHVTLIKGSVEVKSHKGKAARITPGEDARLNADGSFALAQVDVSQYVYWKDGFFYFDNTPLADIMQDIGRWYNVNIVFRNKNAMQYKMHYLCERADGIEHAVELFNMMQKVKVELKGNTLYVE